MTTDIARMDRNAVAILGSSNEALERLGQWVTAAQQAHSLVGPLIGTAFVPDAYKPKVDPRATPEQRAEAWQAAVANATAAVLQGITLGVDPMTALQQIYIIHGRPGMYAKFMVALVQGHGHDVWTEDISDTRAVVAGRRKGSEHIERVTITMEMARKAKWTSNAKYQETPQDMLWARAAARVCDRIASDVIKGITSVEQIRDDEIQATAEVGEGPRTVAPRKRAAAPAITATVEDEPPLDEPVTVVAEVKPARRTAESAPAEEEPTLDDEPKPEMMTDRQQRKLFPLLKERGYQDKDAALALIAVVIGREIASRNELTKVEAGAVIDKLETLEILNPELPADDA